ncbi:MAG: DUF523 and DUF1722 domain-containing protein [Magnetococcales bacterium]|nr:DUF523 and DUF1722 domain-containing protein [Magnetococcales bacterium]
MALGVSQCLLGHEVRYDGGHKHSSYITGVLGPLFRFVPVCPEVEAGFGIPREPIRLEGEPERPRVISQKTRRELTLPLQEAAGRLVGALADERLCGFILKRDSPSCGLERVRVYKENGMPVQQGVGIFAHALGAAFPLLPIEEEGRLNDAALRENFIERVFVYQRWRELLENPSAQALVAFHTRHKFLIMAHSPTHMRQLGGVTGGIKKGGELPLDAYGALLMEGLKRLATPKKNVDALMHMMGFLKAHLSADEKAEMLELLDAYRAERIPLIVPITLLNHYVRKFAPPYLSGQWYLHPHPLELKLRNHA